MVEDDGISPEKGYQAAKKKISPEEECQATEIWKETYEKIVSPDKNDRHRELKLNNKRRVIRDEAYRSHERSKKY